MKLRVEVAPQNEDEIVIRCGARTEQIQMIERMLENVLKADAELVLTLGDTEYYIPKSSILFFETDGAGKVAAHTAEHMYYTRYKLFELEQIMPATFVRVSKSCILNSGAICALSHNLTGASEVMFSGTQKKVYVSRAYYKILKEKIYQMRFSRQ